MYVVLVRLALKPERTDAFKQAILKNAAASVRNEPNCHRFDVCQNESKPAEWMLYEVYTDRASFDFHHQQPHFLEYSAVAQECVLSKELTTYLMHNP
jgi:quinol monooxygenase YgiN